jgi:hypothetical protein
MSLLIRMVREGILSSLSWLSLLLHFDPIKLCCTLLAQRRAKCGGSMRAGWQSVNKLSGVPLRRAGGGRSGHPALSIKVISTRCHYQRFE